MTEAVDDGVPTRAEYVAETLARLPATADDDGFAGETPDWFGPTLFGGFVLGQATSAVVQTAPDGFTIHSFHAYFLSALRAGPEARYEATTLRDGRGFAHRRIDGTQEGRPFFAMTASFTSGTQPDHFEYGRGLADDVPRPADLDVTLGDGPWDNANVGPSEPEPDGFLASSSRRWIRFGGPLPDDQRIHQSLLAFATDTTGQGARPLRMEEDSVAGIISLDHAVWFHRPVRVDEWMFYDVTATINTGGRGHLNARMYNEAGEHVASASQETLLSDPRFSDPKRPA